MAVRKDNTTGLEYKRSLTDEEQKQRAAASVDRIYSIASYVFVIGIIAVGVLIAISYINKSPSAALICEGTVFACLIVLLILVVRAKRRLGEQRVMRERYPYASVDKKEIDKIFDLIADEEKKRDKLNSFVVGGSAAKSRSAVMEEPVAVREPDTLSKKTVQKSEKITPENDDTITDTQPDTEPVGEEETVSVLEDELNDVEIRMRAMAEEEDTEATQVEENPSAAGDAPEEEEPRREKRPRDPSRRPPQGKRPPQQGAPRGKKRPGEGGSRDPRDPRAARDPRDPRAPQGATRRRPPAAYDPYYGAVYYDEYGRPIRRPPPPYDPYYADYYYDEYGQPVRRREAPYGKERVVYDEYGRPIRRRVPPGGDPRREDPARRKRPGAPGAPGAEAGRRRPDGTVAPPAKQSKAPAAPAAPLDPARRTAAPVAMPSLKNDFDEDYVPVSVAYDDDVETTAQDAEMGVTLRANKGKRGASAPPAPPKPVIDDESDYSPTDMEAVPVIVDDDYNPDYGDEDVLSSSLDRSPAAAQHRSSKPANAPDYYYQVEDDIPPEEMDAGVIVVHDFDDIDQDEYDARYSRDYNAPASPAAAARKQNYAVEEEDYSYEEEAVISLPRDEDYEAYLEKVKEEEERKRQEEEKQRIEERKQERRKSGKVALTIRKVRRKKIHRMSRKYKRFRASVVPLNKYLSSYND